MNALTVTLIDANAIARNVALVADIAEKQQALLCLLEEQGEALDASRRAALVDALHRLAVDLEDRAEVMRDHLPREVANAL
ncbi:hypothetical protein HALO32_02856 [Halomonas lysinitropha]|uniref:Uncharacterized protein n=1 Tax=Halomonas lysinitropha TaxID=2607506 RepID=A0A5K1IC45_9GAMM|nr:hypothetical protein [Halomonas lysinitropha]VVZ96749.1 hypothetical protein HALO32_02856 [Halomonas lysinitropha]